MGAGSWFERQSAVRVLGDIQSAQSRTLLARALKDGDRRVRAAAARALGRQRDREALYALRLGLGDSEFVVRIATLRAMARVVTQLARRDAVELLPTLHDWLQPTLRSSIAPERILALGIFLRLGEQNNLAALLQLADALDAETRRLLVEQLENYREPLARFLKDGDATVRTLAAVRLGAQGDRRAVPILQEALGRGGAEALAALGILDRLKVRSTSVQELITLFSAARPEARLAAVAEAMDLPPELTQELLLRAARDPEVEVRQRGAGTSGNKRP